jgi:hypothetical protein
MFGRLPNTPGALQREPISEFYACDNYVKQLESRLKNRYTLARTSVETGKLDNKRHYDRYVFVPIFEIGNNVLVKDESVRRGRSKMLEAPYVGPYEIIKIDVLRTRKRKEIKIHANRANLFYARLQMWAVLMSMLISKIVMGEGLDIRNEPIENSPGLYFQHEAGARLYNSEWKIVTYLNLQQASDNVDVIDKYTDATIGFCKKHDKSLCLNLTECRTTIYDATRRPENLKEIRSLVSLFNQNGKEYALKENRTF